MTTALLCRSSASPLRTELLCGVTILNLGNLDYDRLVLCSRSIVRIFLYTHVQAQASWTLLSRLTLPSSGYMSAYTELKDRNLVYAAKSPDEGILAIGLICIILTPRARIGPTKAR